MTEKIKVSVFCLAYNHEKYIRDALDGFVNQKTNFNYEVFVHDDASQDATPNIIREYAGKYPEIIKPIFQTENQYSKGVNITKNFLYPKMAGEYFAICEGDDYWCNENKLQMLSDFLDTNLYYSACAHESKVLYLATGKTEMRNGHTAEYDMTVEETLDRLTDWKREPWQLSGLMFRREYVFNQPEFISKLKLAGDMSLDLYLLASGKVRFLPQVMSVYRVGSESSKKRQNSYPIKDMPLQQIDMLRSFDEYTNYKYSESVRLCITSRQYRLYEIEEKFSELIKGDMKVIFRRKTLFTKLKTLIKIYCRPIYNIHKKIVSKKEF